ncbi:uncharacterized protein METZ01_LOCUS345017 [marine metagenome]|uniref:Uncharacterized protein n=1 Tax=marine metagenome TaxID=408172 RepID=A0A382R359_9ZZZZ
MHPIAQEFVQQEQLHSLHQLFQLTLSLPERRVAFGPSLARHPIPEAAMNRSAHQ